MGIMIFVNFCDIVHSMEIIISMIFTLDPSFNTEPSTPKKMRMETYGNMTPTRVRTPSGKFCRYRSLCT